MTQPKNQRHVVAMFLILYFFFFYFRLKNDKSGGAWCPKKMVTKEALEYLEVDLHDLHVITGTKTQGRFGNGQGQEYVEEFMLDFWRPGFNKWMRWKSRNRKEVSWKKMRNLIGC